MEGEGRIRQMEEWAAVAEGGSIERVRSELEEGRTEGEHNAAELRSILEGEDSMTS